jgi:hypothetical protein
VKHLIAAFMGAPCGAAWQIMNAAAQNMERYAVILAEEEGEEELDEGGEVEGVFDVEDDAGS